MVQVLQPRTAPSKPELQDSGSKLQRTDLTRMSAQAGKIRKKALTDSGTLSPNPWDLTLSGQNGCPTLKALERRTRLRRDATRAPISMPERQGAAAAAVASTQHPRPRPALAYSEPKMVLTTGSTLVSQKILSPNSKSTRMFGT